MNTIKQLWAAALAARLARPVPRPKRQRKSSKYAPHQGFRECTRRARQIGAGIISRDQLA